MSIRSFYRILQEHNIKCLFDDDLLENLLIAVREDELTREEKEEWILSLIPEIDNLNKDGKRDVIERIISIATPSNINVGCSDNIGNMTKELDSSVVKVLGINECASVSDECEEDSFLFNKTCDTLINERASVSDECEEDSFLLNKTKKLHVLLESFEVNPENLNTEVMTYFINIFSSVNISDEEEQQEVVSTLCSYFPELEGRQREIDEIIEFFLEAIIIEKLQSERAVDETMTHAHECLSNEQDLNLIEANTLETDSNSQEYDEGCIFLSELMPGIEIDLLRYILQVKCLNSRAEAARYLFEDCCEEGSFVNLRAEKSTHEKQIQDQKRKNEKEQQKIRSAILSKFGEQVVKPKYDAKGKLLQSKAPVVLLSTEAGGNQKVRYLDGNIVSYRGEKKVVVNRPEEYDGGSRGRVMPKGKRGAGWVNG